MVAVNVGGAVKPLEIIGTRSNTSTCELPFPTNRKFPAPVISKPWGPESGFRLLEREAQHCPPTNPPKLPLGPKKPGRRKPSVLQPKRVKLPCAVVIGGMVSKLVGSCQQRLLLLPASATEFCPPMAHNAILESVLNTGTSRPTRSDTK